MFFNYFDTSIVDCFNKYLRKVFTNISTSRKDIGYLARYPILNSLIPRDNIDKSSLDIISLKRYRDEILIRYLVRRYIYKIILRDNIFI